MQLCLAYAALVRSASASGQKGAADGEARLVGDVRAGFCIEKLLEAIRLASCGPNESGQRLHRLHLTLIATLPGLSLGLLPRVLEEVKAVIMRRDRNSSAERAEEVRLELVQALFKELSENVGDDEKEFVMCWWYENRDALGGLHETLAPAPEAGNDVLASKL